MNPTINMSNDGLADAPSPTLSTTDTKLSKQNTVSKSDLPHSPDENYQTALRLIRSRAARVMHVTGEPLNLPQFQHPDGTTNIPRFMRYWLDILGYPHPSRDFDIVHVTGTKGKGSTSTFIASFASAHTNSLVGLLTTPHMLSYTERILINGVPVSEKVLADAIHRVWNQLVHYSQTPTPTNPHVVHPRRAPTDASGKKLKYPSRIDPNDATKVPVLPDNFQLFMLASYDIFARAGVKLAVYEVFCGGRVDPTNVFENTFATVFTPIGVDHENLLGQYPFQNAWNKSGIMRLRTPVFSGPQPDDGARECLEWNAADLNSPIEYPTPDDPEIKDLLPTTHPKLSPKVQLSNAALAIRVVSYYLATQGKRLTKEGIIKALGAVPLDARFRVIKRPSEPGVTWFFDSAHNQMSLPIAAEWFASESPRQLSITANQSLPPDLLSTLYKTLIFAYDAKRGPDSMAACMFGAVSALGLSFDLVILSPFQKLPDSQKHINISNTHTVPEIKKLFPSQKVIITCSIAETVRVAEENGAGRGALKHVFVLGSSYVAPNIWAEWQGRQPE